MKVSAANGVQVFGDFKVDSGSLSGGGIKLEGADVVNNNYIELKAPTFVTSSTTLTFPDGAGTSSQVLSTNGSGVLSWADTVEKVNPVVQNVLSINTISSASSPRLFIQGALGNGGVFLKVPDATTATNTTFTLPDADGTSGQVLSTNGSGTLSFTTVSGGGSTNELDGQYLEFFTRSSAYGNGSYEGQVVKYGNNTNLSAGKAYVLSSDGGSPVANATWVEADANSLSGTKGLFGIALGSSATSDGLLVRGIRGQNTGANPGDIMYISTASGTVTNAIPQTPGDFVRVIGYALSSNLLYVDPSPDYIELG
jgi:hypothetical protein